MSFTCCEQIQAVPITIYLLAFYCILLYALHLQTGSDSMLSTETEANEGVVAQTQPHRGREKREHQQEQIYGCFARFVFVSANANTFSV